MFQHNHALAQINLWTFFFFFLVFQLRLGAFFHLSGRHLRTQAVQHTHSCIRGWLIISGTVTETCGSQPDVFCTFVRAADELLPSWQPWMGWRQLWGWALPQKSCRRLGTQLPASWESAPVDPAQSSCPLSMNIKFPALKQKSSSFSSKPPRTRTLYAVPHVGGELLRSSLITRSPNCKILTSPVKPQHRVFHFCLYWISPGTSDNILTCDRCFLHKDIFQADFSPAAS